MQLIRNSSKSSYGLCYAIDAVFDVDHIEYEKGKNILQINKELDWSAK